MAKVKCSICANEAASFCIVKKSRIKLNKKRLCEVYIYDESKVKAKQVIPTIKFGYKEQEEHRKRMKEELKALKELMKQQPQDGTAKSLGLLKEATEESRIIQPGDTRFAMPTGDQKHPLTGDLSRFATTVNKSEIRKPETI
jgi:hypothetical protein